MCMDASMYVCVGVSACVYERACVCECVRMIAFVCVRVSVCM